MTTRRTRRTQRYRIADGVAHREIEGQMLLLAPGESGLLTLNTTGQFLWKRIAKGDELDAMTRAFQRAFRITADVAAADVRAFVSSLEARKFIRRG